MVSLSRPRALRSSRRALMAIGAIALGALVMGCGGSASGSTAPASIPAGATTVKASDYKFDPATVTAMPGSATFVVTNAGSTEHEFRIFKGDTAVGAVEALAPGATGQVTVTLEPGSYTYVCKIAAHDQIGMKGSLTVGAS